MKRLFIGFMAAMMMIPAAARAQDDSSWLLEQVNALRGSVGVHAYVINAQLAAAAYQHSEYMATTCDISHTEANGSTPASRAAANGYTGSFVSENIYGTRRATAADALNFWINSPIHYNGLVHGRNNEVGFGVVSGPCGNYYTMLMGYNSGVSAPPAPPPDPAAGEAPADSEAPAAPPPTRAPYVPPPPTRTPTATIPTLTPSATWTITPTYTPSPTGTAQPPTETPLVLPTVPAPGQETAVALVSSPTGETILVLSPTSAGDPGPAPQLAAVAAKPSSEDGGFELRDLIPFALVGQIVLIGLAGFAYFRRSQ